MKMERIFITGNAGSGKTTLSKKIGAILNREVISLDTIVWQPGWVITPPKERSVQIGHLIKSNRWIIDGVSKDLLKAADTIIFLDYPRRTSYWRVFKRNWRYLFKSRPELPKNCPEILIMKKLIQIIWNFQKMVRPGILDYIEENKGCKNIFHIRDNSALNSFISIIEAKR
ncbi:AAA family ATPase [Legionella anisa]|uniref:AAA family ATPase n=1 Tax=Legionella anisa TaxID=28082 RepID=UPI0013EF6F00|nr:AAA family ATPase [Legionella anisa]